MKKATLIALLLLLVGGPEFPRPRASDPGERKIPGVAYDNYRNRSAPWSIHVVRIDRSKTEYELLTSLAEGKKIGINFLSEQMAEFPKELGKPIAAINGDFFRISHEEYAGDPRGLQIRAGELVSGPGDRSTFWIGTNGVAQIGEVLSRFMVTWANGEKSAFNLNEERGWSTPVLYTAAMGTTTMTRGGAEIILEKTEDPWLPLQPGRTYKGKVRQVRSGGNSRLNESEMVLSIPRLSEGKAAVGDIISISTATSPDLAGVRTAIGGGPALVHDGKPVPARAYKAYDRHPRAAIGWNEKEWLLVAVDGRQSSSMGMTLPELAEILVKLKCDEAMNLDGGGSVELWMDGQVLNNPCYGERAMANTIVLVEKKKAPKP